MTDRKTYSRRGPSRRALLAGAGAGGLALAMGGRGAFAAGAENVLKIGFISPRTGALAGFGETDGYVLELARKALGQGLAIGGKTYEVQILDRDTQSDPSRASQLAKTLINSDGVDLMLPISTPETINPVADACEAAGVPCLSTVMPWEAWYFGRGGKPGQPSPFKWSYHFGFGGGEFFKAYVSLWNSVETNKKVGVLYPNDADGNAIRENLAPGLAKAGFTIVDPGPYEDGTTDYSAQIAKFKAEKCEIFNTFPIPPDFAAFWRQAAQQGLTKQLKIVQIAKTGLFASTVDSLGSLAPGLAKAGFTIIDPGPYEDGTTDYSAQIARFKSEKCEIFNTFPIPPDFAAFWRQAAQQGYTKMVKIAQTAKTGLFPSDVTALGALGVNISSAAYWHKAFPYKSSLAGISGDELADGYEMASGKQWTQQLGASLSLLDAGFAALQAAGAPKDKGAVAKALATLKTTTIAGLVDFTAGPVPNVASGPIIGTQWVKAKPGSKFALDYVVTDHATDPNVPIGAKLKPYNG